MFPTIFIGSVKISTYWLMFAIGVSSMIVLMIRRRKRYSLLTGRAVLFAFLITIFGLSGTKILGALQNWEEVQREGLSAAGLSFFGAVFLIPIGMTLCAGLFRMPKPVALDATAPCLASMVSFMRVGCFLNGCCGGWETELFGFSFHWPVQAMESIGDFFMLGLILQMEEKGQHKGKRYAVFLVGYGILRFCLEFLRTTDKRLLGLGDGQWFAILGVLIGIAVLKNKLTKMRK